MNDVWRLPARLGRTAGGVGDCVLAVLIVLAAIPAWSPLIGLLAAREAVAVRRGRRARLAEIDRVQSPVWARQARRNALGGKRQAAAVAWRPYP